MELMHTFILVMLCIVKLRLLVLGRKILKVSSIIIYICGVGYRAFLPAKILDVFLSSRIASLVKLIQDVRDRWFMPMNDWWLIFTAASG